MKELLAYIQHKKAEFAQLPLFEYLQDSRISPRQRLAFAPCLSPMVMGFGDLWKYVFRVEGSNDPLQTLINLHTYEEEFHWQWILEDIPKLGLDEYLPFSNALKFLWSEENQKTRRVCPVVERYASHPDPVQKLIAIQVSEVTANVFFSATAKVIQELKLITKEEYRYFGGNHLGKENNHHINTDTVVKSFEEIQVSDEQQQRMFEIVDEIFAAFTESMDELLVYAKKHSVERELQVA